MTRAALVGSDSQAATDSPRRTRANAEEPPRRADAEDDVEDSLGLTTEPATPANGPRGLKLTAVRPGSAAAKAGLHTGDVIRAVNGYVTERPAHLRWILAHAVTENALKMTVSPVTDGEPQKVTLPLPLGMDSSRPSP